jgi:hypothetical protein
MKRPRRAPRTAASGSRGFAGGAADESRIEALTVAMALAPGVYARNRMFELFASSGVQRAKARAATLRGIVRHLARACALTLEREDARRDRTGAADFVLRYQIPAMRLSRVVELSRVELATLRMLAARAGAPSLLPEDEDRALVNATLARLLTAGGDTGNLARAAQNVTSPDAPPRADSQPP